MGDAYPQGPACAAVLDAHIDVAAVEQQVDSFAAHQPAPMRRHCCTTPSRARPCPPESLQNRLLLLRIAITSDIGRMKQPGGCAQYTARQYQHDGEGRHGPIMRSATIDHRPQAMPAAAIACAGRAFRQRRLQPAQRRVAAARPCPAAPAQSPNPPSRCSHR